MHISKKGFLLADSIVCLLIVSILSVLAIMLYRNISNYNEGYKEYIEFENEEYKEVFSTEECTPRVCAITDDSSDDDSADYNSYLDDNTIFDGTY